MIELGLTTTGSGVILYATFCRLVRTNAHTKLRVRFAIWLVAIAATAALVGPLLTSWRPDIVHALMAGAFAMHLLVSSRAWRYGVPTHYQRGLS